MSTTQRFSQQKSLIATLSHGTPRTPVRHHRRNASVNAFALINLADLPTARCLLRRGRSNVLS
jgi:hypothetical protein